MLTDSENRFILFSSDTEIIVHKECISKAFKKPGKIFIVIGSSVYNVAASSFVAKNVFNIREANDKLIDEYNCVKYRYLMSH